MPLWHLPNPQRTTVSPASSTCFVDSQLSGASLPYLCFSGSASHLTAHLLCGLCCFSLTPRDPRLHGTHLSPRSVRTLLILTQATGKETSAWPLLHHCPSLWSMCARVCVHTCMGAHARVCAPVCTVHTHALCTSKGARLDDLMCAKLWGQGMTLSNYF